MEAQPRWALVIHGGAGAITRPQLSLEQEQAYRQSLAQIAAAGAKALRGGVSALDAVESTVRLLEDEPLYNAGRGAVFNAEGRNELDSAIMDGRTLAAGAVAGATRTRHPISLAREIMQHSPHVMLAGDPAEEFARSRGLEQVEPAFFFTHRRWQSLERYLRSAQLPIPQRPAGVPAMLQDAGNARFAHDEGKHGTVGVVACDMQGNIAAGTSTGGLTGKRWGRVGDSPVIGAGTYAANASCAVSGTGTGEYFIRLTIAREICALVEYKQLSLQAAADEVVKKRLTALGGDGGVIAVAADGQMAWSFNTAGMYRARVSARTPVQVGIYGDEG
ncbi:MAG: isoaspartyl peptidase/L-asparaginase [Steroidobacteraceae bacterium]